jgi:hypothetical protein
MKQEILKEIARQAGFYFYNMHDVDGQDLGETVEADSWSAVEKFAELIVKECFKSAMVESKGHLNPVDLIESMKARVGL